jgi:hypothetical protein
MSEKIARPGALWIASLVLALCLGLQAAPARAEIWEDLVVEALVDQGYEVSMIHRTMLGRVRIVAISETLRREIVLNPHTGEVLRDYSSILPTSTHSAPRRERDRPSDPASLATSGVGAVSESVAPRATQGGD